MNYSSESIRRRNGFSSPLLSLLFIASSFMLLSFILRDLGWCSWRCWRRCSRKMSIRSCSLSQDPYVDLLRFVFGKPSPESHRPPPLLRTPVIISISFFQKGIVIVFIPIPRLTPVIQKELGEKTEHISFHFIAIA